MEAQLQSESPGKKDELSVVVISDAIVKPDAVVVEVLRAPVAALAVFGLFFHRGITQVTEEVEILGFLRTLFLTIGMSMT